VESQKEIKNGQHDGMMPGRDRDLSTWRTGLMISRHVTRISDPFDADPDPAFKAEYRSGSRVFMTKN
jgi:hypothetical protein